MILAAKNATLIVEVARELRPHDKETLEAAPAYFRPIAMTPFPFWLVLAADARFDPPRDDRSMVFVGAN